MIVRCGAIVTDIEGTTGSIAFVKDVLFPYAKEHLAEFIARRGREPDVARALRDARFEASEPDADDARICAILCEWMDLDIKATPLKTLQGLIWEEGYAKTGLRGHVYPDAAAGLRRWHAAGINLYVYSSGSVTAQKLLFANSTEGDLSPLFSGYFDTTTGIKTDASSYRKIAEEIGMNGEDILFLSDREAELDAAHRMNWQVACIARPADVPAGMTPSKHPTYTSFDDIDAEI
jgi:enolase-phosphatase E1